MPSLRTHAQHFAYVAQRKRLFLQYARRLRVRWWHIVTHDLHFFRPSLWALGVRVFHGPDAEQWIHERAQEILGYTEHPAQDKEEAANTALRMARDEYGVHAKHLAALNDRFAMHHQRRPWRWESYIVRDLAETRYCEMPEYWVRVMVADWLTGARMSGTPADEVFVQVRKWYARHRDVIRITPALKKYVTQLLEAQK